jgi:hypothetical protein
VERAVAADRHDALYAVAKSRSGEGGRIARSLGPLY